MRGPARVRRSKFLRISEAAEESRGSRSLIRLRIEDGTLSALRLGGIVLIERRSFERWLASAEPWTPAAQREARQ